MPRAFVCCTNKMQGQRHLGGAVALQSARRCLPRLQASQGSGTQLAVGVSCGRLLEDADGVHHHPSGVAAAGCTWSCSCVQFIAVGIAGPVQASLPRLQSTLRFQRAWHDCVAACLRAKLQMCEFGTEASMLSTSRGVLLASTALGSRAYVVTWSGFGMPCCS